MSQARIQNDDVPYTFLGKPRDDYGVDVIDLVRPPQRFWPSYEAAPPLFKQGIEVLDLTVTPSPAALLARIPESDTISAQSRRSLAALRANFLVVGDPQRRLDAKEVLSLSHQASLVRHVMDSPNLNRVMIADEVGLGKTVEAGLIIQEILDRRPRARVLYLCPARLVQGVHREFRRLGLTDFRRYAVEGTATVDDPRVIASIHKSIHPANFSRFVDSAPWDVIVVDECHHLKPSPRGGGDPTQKYSLVRQLVEKAPAEVWILLMSGTPHQGHEPRFENLLRFLKRPDESLEDVGGRVIFRTKEDVVDWHGQPLFPKRNVRSPLIIELGDSYRQWLADIRSFYLPDSSGQGSESQARAGGWRCAQAMQWAASSVHAGLGYLIRQAIRVGWAPTEVSLRAAMAALRPYRLGPVDEPLDILFRRIQRDIRLTVEVLEDIEEEVGEAWTPDPDALAMLLCRGTELLRSPVATLKWEQIYETALSTTDEQVVLFAQPVETVVAFADFLARKTGEKPEVIIGGQKEAEREALINRFCSSKGPRFLVSSRAGGEGINLQVARRLVHLDVPWNPMEMEQRVGRVHRFGSKRTILVDTVVTKGSPEERAYAAARERLQIIASAMGSEDRFESLFSRVMTLIPAQDLQDVFLAARPDFVNQDRIGQLVKEGFETWRSFHDRFAESQKRIHEIDPGQAEWEDVWDFVLDRLKAEPLGGYVTHQFVWKESGNEVATVERSSRVARLGDDDFFCEESSGLPVTGPEGKRARMLGLNTRSVLEALRSDALPQLATGAAWLRWDVEMPRPPGMPSGAFGILVVRRQSYRPSDRRILEERETSLHGWIVPREAAPVPIAYDALCHWVRGLLRARIRREAEEAGDLIQRIQDLEAEKLTELCVPTREDRQARIRHACTPLFAAVLTDEQR